MHQKDMKINEFSIICIIKTLVLKCKCVFYLPVASNLTINTSNFQIILLSQHYYPPLFLRIKVQQVKSLKQSNKKDLSPYHVYKKSYLRQLLA